MYIYTCILKINKYYYSLIDKHLIFFFKKIIEKWKKNSNTTNILNEFSE